jgi:hypothetical protein
MQYVMLTPQRIEAEGTNYNTKNSQEVVRIQLTLILYINIILEEKKSKRFELSEENNSFESHKTVYVRSKPTPQEKVARRS